MRFCDECKRKNDWFGFVTRGFAMCEVCRRTRVCYDVPHDKLAVIPPQPGIKKMKEPMTKTAENTAPVTYTVQVVIQESTSTGVMRGIVKRAEMLNVTVSASTPEEAVRKAKGIMDVSIDSPA